MVVDFVTLMIRLDIFVGIFGCFCQRASILLLDKFNLCYKSLLNSCILSKG